MSQEEQQLLNEANGLEALAMQESDPRVKYQSGMRDVIDDCLYRCECSSTVSRMLML